MSLKAVQKFVVNHTHPAPDTDDGAPGFAAPPAAWRLGKPVRRRRPYGRQTLLFGLSAGTGASSGSSGSSGSGGSSGTGGYAGSGEKTGSTSTPSWVATLANSVIKADMAAADVNGTVTYAGLKTLLTDLDATLTSSKTTLTSAEFSDLKTIAANLNNGMTTSAT